MRPDGLKTRIFLDGGDLAETEACIKLLGFLDGQTTNPTLIAKNPGVQERLKKGEKFGRRELLDFYCTVVEAISRLIPDGSVSVEVYADETTTAREMLAQGREMFSWIPNAHIKFPTITAGLRAAELAIPEGLRVNMTLCFSQRQAAAVYAATRGAKRGAVFVSPFIGRLDDRGECGMELVENIVRMFARGDGHVEVLTASVRSVAHFLSALKNGTDIVTAPFKVIKEWGEMGLPLPEKADLLEGCGLKPIAYEDIDLERAWREYDIHHDLTDLGIERFSADWNSLLKEPAHKIY